MGRAWPGCTGDYQRVLPAGRGPWRPRPAALAAGGGGVFRSATMPVWLLARGGGQINFSAGFQPSSRPPHRLSPCFLSSPMLSISPLLPFPPPFSFPSSPLLPTQNGSPPRALMVPSSCFGPLHTGAPGLSLVPAYPQWILCLTLFRLPLQSLSLSAKQDNQSHSSL